MDPIVLLAFGVFVLLAMSGRSDKRANVSTLDDERSRKALPPSNEVWDWDKGIPPGKEAWDEPGFSWGTPDSRTPEQQEADRKRLALEARHTPYLFTAVVKLRASSIERSLANVGDLEKKARALATEYEQIQEFYELLPQFQSLEPEVCKLTPSDDGFTLLLTWPFTVLDPKKIPPKLHPLTLKWLQKNKDFGDRVTSLTLRYRRRKR